MARPGFIPREQRQEVKIGAVFGYLTVIGPPHHREERYELFWPCECVSCGNLLSVTTHCLRSGAIRSCGCMRKGFPKHALRYRKIYAVWTGIKQRCENTRNTNYPQYGGRGIRICAFIRASVANLQKVMGERPTMFHEIDRKDNDKGYTCGQCDDCKERGEPANLQWATRKHQNRNKRSNRYITFRGETLCIGEWAERLNVSPGLLQNRLNRMPVEKAMTNIVRQMQERMTDEEVRIFRRACAVAKLSDVCRHFGISVARGWGIVHRKVYKDVV